MDNSPQRNSRSDIIKTVTELLLSGVILAFVINQISSEFTVPLTTNLIILVVTILILLTVTFISNRKEGKRGLFPWLPVISGFLGLVIFIGSIGAFKFGWLGIFPSPQPNPVFTLPHADVNGWLIVQEHTRGDPRTLLIVDPRTGGSAPLWPSSQELQSPKLTIHYTSFTDPTYSPDLKKVAFVGHLDDDTKVVLLASISISNNGLPFIADAPQQITTICNLCDNIISLSKSGHWLIYKGIDGLYAISTVTFEQIHITPSSKDRWPACSPDGNWLAYQGVTNSILAVPTVDCLPSKTDSNKVKYLNGAVYSWSPQWSADSKKIAFISNYSHDWQTYELSLSNMGNSNNPIEITPINRIGTSKCHVTSWAQNNTQNLLLMSCDKSGTSDSLLIEPDNLDQNTFSPPWQAELNANGVSWEKSIWLPNNL